MQCNLTHYFFTFYKHLFNYDNYFIVHVEKLTSEVDVSPKIRIKLEPFERGINEQGFHPYKTEKGCTVSNKSVGSRFRRGLESFNEKLV